MAKVLSYFLLALVPFVISGSYDMIIKILNYLIGILAPAAVAVVGLFPDNPCGSLIGSCSIAVSNLPPPDPTLLAKVLSFMAWFLPMGYLADLVGCIMLTVIIYFTMAPLARWFKLIT
ncbi:MAG: hypothetical protein EG822_12605 [Deltaproteobacteria bacterium]|nr:hypothetical protein [Deltaproteobacteria bacterium]TLN03808.1 MAG: hypothetical protein FDZ73_06390 [bacterium]